MYKKIQLDVSEHSSKPDHNHTEPKTTVYTTMQRDINKYINKMYYKHIKLRKCMEKFVYYCMKTFIAKLNIISKLVQKEQLKK
jgi:hypothetical protein